MESALWISTCVSYLPSQHDTTVACMMSALGVFNGLRPPYSTAFFVELLSNRNG